MDKERFQVLVAEERKAYFREWRSKNKDKVKKHNEDYWKRRTQKKLSEQAQSEEAK